MRWTSGSTKRQEMKPRWWDKENVGNLLARESHPHTSPSPEWEWEARGPGVGGAKNKPTLAAGIPGSGRGKSNHSAVAQAPLPDCRGPTILVAAPF